MLENQVWIRVHNIDSHERAMIPMSVFEFDPDRIANALNSVGTPIRCRNDGLFDSDWVLIDLEDL